jgi:tripartite-type tricarboxylate transporter receptor subunit TctC
MRLVVFMMVCILGLPAAADDFYKGKQITITVGAGAGGTYERYMRMLAEFWPRHIPGEPGIVIVNRPGAGGVVAANFVSNAAPKDGTHVGLTLNLVPLFQVAGGSGVKYDITQMQWIGNMWDAIGILAVSDRAPAKTIEAAKSTEVALGCVGRGSETFIVPQVMNALWGTKYKCVMGYPGITEIDLAIERGEVFGRGGSWYSFLQTRPDWVREKKIIPLAQVAFKKDPTIPEVPRLIDLARNPNERVVFELVSSSAPFSRAPFAPPGVPKERVEILRRAFDKTMADPEFLATMKSRNVEISPNTGEELQKIAADLLKTPPNQVALLKAALELDKEK